jgi:hypothetical protein
VEQFLIELADVTDGKAIWFDGRTGLPDSCAVQVLNGLETSSRLTGWGRGLQKGFHYDKGGMRYSRKHMANFSEFPKIRVARSPDRFVKVIAAGEQGFSFRTINCTENGTSLTKDGNDTGTYSDLFGTVYGKVLLMFAKKCLTTELTFDYCSYSSEKSNIVDLLNEFPERTRLKRWGIGALPEFTGSSKPHILRRIEELAKFDSIRVGSGQEEYVRVAVTTADTEAYGSNRYEIFVVFCDQSGGEAKTTMYKPQTTKTFRRDKTPQLDVTPSSSCYTTGKKGNVYALINPSMPGLFKVGRTIAEPADRAKALSSGTNMPTPFEVYAYTQCNDYVFGERTAHDMLDKYRVSGKEFFRAPEEDIIRTLNDVGGGKVVTTGVDIVGAIAVVPEAKITKEMIIDTFLQWAKKEHQMVPSDILISKRVQCARVRLGKYGSESDWVTVPFGSFNSMIHAVSIHKGARERVLEAYGGV